MKKIELLLIIVASVFITSCTKSPKACFTFSKTVNVKIGDTLTLVNCSENYTDIQWIFPQNGISKSTSPRIKIANWGTYAVQLNVGTDNFKKTNSVTNSIEVKP